MQSSANCNPAPTATAQVPNGTSTQNNSSVSSEAQNVKDAAKQLGSLFKKKPAAPASNAPTAPTAAPNPCPAQPVVSATATSAATPAAPAAPAAAAPNAAPSGRATTPVQPATQAQSQLPPAPANGLDPSKLPDIQGIHLGMPPNDLLPKLNVLYPTGKGPFAFGLKVANAQYLHAPDKPWVANVIATLDCSRGNCGSDQFRVIFSAPPNKQVAVYLQRATGFQSGKFPTQQTLIAALTQKYGPNAIIPTPAYPGILIWAFDEQGQPLVPAPPKNKVSVGCVTGTILSPANSIDRYIGGISPLTQADVTRLATEKCALGVYVVADLGQGNGGVVPSMTVTIVENSEDLRDAIAGQQYLDSVAATQQQQQLKNAQGQSVPKL